MSHRKDESARPSKVDLDHVMSRIRRDLPGLPRRGLAAVSDDGSPNQGLARISDRRQMTTGGAARLPRGQFAEADRPATRLTRPVMLLACQSPARWASGRTCERVRPVIHVTHGAVLLAAKVRAAVVHPRQMGGAVLFAIDSTHAAVFSADGLRARNARGDLVASKDDMHLDIALRTMLLAYQAATAVSAPQVLGAVNLMVHCAQGLVIGAHGLLARRATHHFIPADRLVAPSFAVERTLPTQPPNTLRSPWSSRHAVRRANHTAAYGARRQARRARPMTSFCTLTFMLATVLAPARRAATCMSPTCRRAVYVACGDPVPLTEGLSAHTAQLAAFATRHMVLGTDT